MNWLIAPKTGKNLRVFEGFIKTSIKTRKKTPGSYLPGAELNSVVYMLVNGWAIIGQRLKGIAVIKPPNNYTLNRVNAETLYIML